ncbi:hypothetical protein [Aliivibrio fischeri]|uniref:hypothetical protein n=1 Tax=Aliivibrio fischeri TaxID=668 RepID=UPI0007C4C581|nr:hypothetical protein [Aliivibrio fischeri]
MKSQKDIIGALSKEEQQILQNMMTLEQTNLYINDLEKNKSREKEIVQEVVKLVERVVSK